VSFIRLFLSQRSHPKTSLVKKSTPIVMNETGCMQDVTRTTLWVYTTMKHNQCVKGLIKCSCLPCVRSRSQVKQTLQRRLRHSTTPSLDDSLMGIDVPEFSKLLAGLDFYYLTGRARPGQEAD
jgi:hypothetical protein